MLVAISTAKIANFEQITTFTLAKVIHKCCHFYRKDSEF